MLELSNK